MVNLSLAALPAAAPGRPTARKRSQRRVYPPLAPHARQRVRAGRLPQVGRGWAGS